MRSLLLKAIKAGLSYDQFEESEVLQDSFSKKGSPRKSRKAVNNGSIGPSKEQNALDSSNDYNASQAPGRAND